MWDVVISGAGPAGSIAATMLARAGARVLLMDRARFPRPKLCGDSVNPGTLALLRRLDLAGWIDRHGLPIEGMIVRDAVSGGSTAARYPEPARGRTAARSDFDFWLLQRAMDAGASFEDAVVVRRPLMSADPGGGQPSRVAGVIVAGRAGADLEIRARVTIGADGRRSPLAFGLGLASHPSSPRRWAIGAYFEGVADMSAFGEMHIGRGQYLGIAPLPGGLTNACVVGTPATLGHGGRPERALRAFLDRDRGLAERFAGARLAGPPIVLGPLAVAGRAAGAPGLLLAGDAAGFVDPMTGDGLRFAVEGAALAAAAALEMLATGDMRMHIALAERRKAAFAWKYRFNRTLRRLIDAPAALRLTAWGTSLAPGIVRQIVSTAGDCRPGRRDR